MNNINIKFITTGSYLPEKIVTNDDLSKIVDTNDEWIKTRTGISERRFARDDETVVELAYKAALDALNKSNFNKNEIDLIIVASITSPVKTPSIANLVQGMLGLNDNHVMAFDVNAACTGYIYALEIASGLLNSGLYKNALVIGAEKMTSILDFTDRSTCVLFGDGAGASIITKSDDKKHQVFFHNNSKGDLNKVLWIKPYVKMEGREVFRFAVDALPRAINEVLENANLTIDDIDLIVPHQANDRIIQSVSKDMKIPMSKFLMNIEKYGNTSAASIPILLSEYESNENDLKRVIIVGFGGGFTWGAALINI